MVGVKLHKRLNHQRIVNVDLGLDVGGLHWVDCCRTINDRIRADADPQADIGEMYASTVLVVDDFLGGLRFGSDDFCP